MSQVTFKGSPVATIGALPTVGADAPDFSLTANDLSQKSLKDFIGKRVILNIFPSIDTGTCATSVRVFNQKGASLDNTLVVNISRDLPFAQARFCATEGIDNAITLSEYKDNNFSTSYGVKVADGALEGLLSRAVVVIDEQGKVIYEEQVQELTAEPNYDAALAVL